MKFLLIALVVYTAMSYGTFTDVKTTATYNSGANSCDVTFEYILSQDSQSGRRSLYVFEQTEVLEAWVFATDKT